MLIEVEARPQYGQLRYYPTDPAIAEAYTRLTGHKTVIAEHTGALATLGIKVEVIQDDSPFNQEHRVNSETDEDVSDWLDRR